MNVSAKAAVVVVMLGANAAVSASTMTFDFSYLFGDGQEVTGDFSGTTTNGGQSVTNISNIQVQLDGISFAPVVVGGVTLGNATLQPDTWNPSTDSYSDTTPVTIFANGALNNFAFSDVDVATNTSPDYEFVYINDPTNDIYAAVAANTLQGQLAQDAPGNAADWTLTEAQPPGGGVGDAPIPLWALGVLGASLMGIASRRAAKTP